MFNEELCEKLSFISGKNTEDMSAMSASYVMCDIMDIHGNFTHADLSILYSDIVQKSVQCLESNINDNEATFVLLYAGGPRLYNDIIDKIKGGQRDIKLKSEKLFDTVTFEVE